MTYKDKDKQKQAQREWYLKNKELTYKRTVTTREKRKNIVNDLKESKPCLDCNVSFPYFVMDFDHLDSDLKINEVSRLLRTSSLDAVLDEIDKCEVICANCHRIRTHKRSCNGCYRCK